MTYYFLRENKLFEDIFKVKRVIYRVRWKSLNLGIAIAK